ncbi:MAG TPA: hypothetical protein VL096_12445 [Pirellulaceae bacterium]|nr:hypothetical protein [Pirellulaceae bacterium]
MAQRPTSRPSGGDAPRGNWRSAGQKASVKRETPLYLQSNPGNHGIWWKRVLSLGLVFILVLVFIAVIRWIPRSTPLVVVTVTDYAAPAPPNGWAKEDAQALLNAWPMSGAWKDYWNNFLVEVADRPPPSGEAFIDATLALLKKHPAGGPGKNVRVLYLSAHGLVNAAGEPCLLLANPRDDAATAIWPGKSADLPLVSVPQLINRLRDQAKEQRGSRYVVLLETNRIDSAWQLGVLENDFAARLAKFMNDNASPGDNRVVLINSASPGEVGLAYPEYGASGFAMFVRSGLLGAADASGDRKVTLHELRNYLLQNVDVLARQARFRTQQPVLLPFDTEDFAVAYAQSSADDPLVNAAQPVAESLEQSWRQTYGLWQQHAQFTLAAESNSHGNSVIERQLPSFTAFEQGLLRLDQLCDAGSAYSAEFESLAGKLEQFATKLAATQNQSLPFLETPVAADKADDKAAPRFYEAELLRSVLAGGEQQADALKKWNELPLATQQHYVWQRFSDQSQLPVEAGLTLLTAEATPAQLAKEPAGIRTMRRFRTGGYLPSEVATNRVLLQQMFGLRSKPEIQASGDGDLRAHYVAVPYVNDVDTLRRQGEDRMYLGDIPAVEESVTKAKAAYQSHLHDSAQLAKALQLRDAAWRELPYYADWAVTLQRQSPPNSPARTSANQQVQAARQAIELNTRFTQLLEWLIETARGESSNVDIATLTARSRELHDALEQQRNQLRTALRTAVSDCTTGAHDRANLAQLLQVLRVPLASASRQTLRERYLKILAEQRELSLTKVDDKSAASESSPGDLIPAADLNSLAKLGPHPGALLWAAQRRFPVAIAGLKIEELTTTRAPEDSTASSFTLPLMELASKLEVIRGTLATAPRNTLSGADMQCRALLSFATLPPTFDQTEVGLDFPQRKLRDFDRHHYLVWQANRTLNDFWGAADAPPGATNQGDYFALVADDYLQQANRLYSNQSEPLRKAQQELTLRKQAAQQLLSQVVAANIAGKPIEGAKTFERAINWPDSDLKGRVSGLPGGAAALYTLTPGGERGKVLLRQAGDGPFRLEAAQPIVSAGDKGAVLPAKLEFELPDDATAPSDSSFDLVFYYRGHAERQLVGVGKLVPATVTVWEKPAEQRPQVVLQGDIGAEKNRGSVAILLDCSHSMDEKFPGGDSRMKVALSALREITTELEKSGQKDFTVWLFGHRRYMPTNAELDDPAYNLGGSKFRVPWNTAFGPTDDVNIHFHNDVQRVWPADKGGLALRDLLNPERGMIRPWGRTALYTAMYRAIVEDLSKRDKSAPRRMLILSDGDHFVRNEKDERITYVPAWKYQASEDKSARDLIDALRQDFGDKNEERIRLHVVDLSGGAATKIKADKIVETVQGNYHAVSDLEELKRVLQDAAGLYQYAVYDETRQDYLYRNVPINQVKEFESYKGQKYSLRLEGVETPGSAARFNLFSGEKLAYSVKYENNQPRVVPLRKRYEGRDLPNIPNPSRPVNDEDFYPKEFRVGVLVPLRIGPSDVEFRITVQNQNIERFSPRPQSAWVEIEPGNTVENVWQPSGERYAFSDLAFQFDQPVPVMRQVARGWPRDAKEARVQTWFSLQDWPSSTTEPLRKLRVASADDEENFKLKPPGLPNNLRFAVQIAARAEGGAYVIVTQLADTDRPLPIRVKLSREPDAIRRQYYRAPHAGRAQTIFEYHTASPDSLLDEFIDIQTLSSLEPIAARLKEPVTIRVPEN